MGKSSKRTLEQATAAAPEVVAPAAAAAGATAAVAAMEVDASSAAAPSPSKKSKKDKKEKKDAADGEDKEIALDQLAEIAKPLAVKKTGKHVLRLVKKGPFRPSTALAAALVQLPVTAKGTEMLAQPFPGYGRRVKGLRTDTDQRGAPPFDLQRPSLGISSAASRRSSSPSGRERRGESLIPSLSVVSIADSGGVFAPLASSSSRPTSPRSIFLRTSRCLRRRPTARTLCVARHSRPPLRPPSQY